MMVQDDDFINPPPISSSSSTSYISLFLLENTPTTKAVVYDTRITAISNRTVESIITVVDETMKGWWV